MMNRMHISLGLMLLSLVLIIAFQSWWLHKSYREEAETMQIRTNMLFRETVLRLQVSKLKLDSTFRIRIPDEGDAVGMINVLREKIRDTVQRSGAQSTMIVSMDKNRLPSSKKDTIRKVMVHYERRPDRRPDKILFDVLAGSDSPKDSITIKEIDEAYQKALADARINVPFQVSRFDLDKSFGEREIALTTDKPEVTVGFLNPMTFKLQLLNTTPYLLKQMGYQLLFSLFLLGVTIISFLSLYRNLLAQKKLAEIKNEFISNITHELKTPIATVSVAIEALRNFNGLDDPGKTKEYLDISQNELQRLSLLVDKVLKLSMFEKKEVELKLEEMDLRSVVDEVVASMRLQLEKFNAQLSVETEGEDFTIEADRLHITSVLYNLLDNALKYSRENPVIKIQLSVLPRDIIELKVSDNGIGIAKEYQRKIFDKFFRVPMGNRHDIKGYGLGLSYVSEIVQRHMGLINVDSESGKGTTFTIKLPRKKADVIYFDDKRKIFKETINIRSIKKLYRHE